MSGNVSNAFFLKTYLNLLSRLRESGSAFAKQNPEIAPYLDMTHRQSADPEIERLIESFAFMTAQVEYKSLLSQNEYLLQFIENILPEITQPVPGLSMVKLNVTERLFEDQDARTVINSGTLLSIRHSDGQIFYFSSPTDYTLSPFQIIESGHLSAGSTKENLYQHKKALFFKLRPLFPVNARKNEKIKFRFYINSDINSILNMIDAVFSANQNLIFINEDGEKIELTREHISIPFEFDNYTQQNNNSNCLYPLFDFCKFFNKYYYFEFTLPEYISISGEVKILVPLDPTSTYKFDVKDNTFLTNCFPFFNYFQKTLKSIKTQENLYEYEIHADFLKQYTSEIISINDVSTIHPVTNESQELVHYHKRELANIHDRKIYQNCYWVSRRSFSSETEQHGTLLLRLVLADETVFLPEYLKIKAFCTNGKDVAKVLPESSLVVEKSNLHFESETLTWIQPQENITDIVEKIDTISYLFLINQKILSNNFDDAEDILKAFEILSSTNNPIYLIYQRTLNAAKSITKTSQNDMKVLHGATYHVPGYQFTFHFGSKRNIPLGFFFMLKFLNGYFSYVRGLNFFIKFSYSVDEIGNKQR